MATMTYSIRYYKIYLIDIPLKYGMYLSNMELQCTTQTWNIPTQYQIDHVAHSAMLWGLNSTPRDTSCE